MKQIIALDTASNGTDNFYRIAFWFPVTSGVRTTSVVSQWSGASVAENSAITSGTVIEEVKTFDFSIGTPTATIKSVIQQAWVNRNAQINGVGPNSVFGIFFDSITGWSA